MSRASDRTVFIFNGQGTNEQLGGLVNNEGITNNNFFEMLEILLIFRSSYTLRLESGGMVPHDDAKLRDGKYYVHARDFAVNDELILLRTPSVATNSRDRAFTTAVRHRDNHCVLTGETCIDWIGLEAAHVFPLAYGAHWETNEFGRWITDGSASINSVQNGMLLRSDLHKRFDMYLFSINPDDNHKIVFFQKDPTRISGKCLDRNFLDHPDRCADQLLRWHYRQTVLMNLKGDGEIFLEHDFPPGSDMMGQIVEAPRAAERMEFELFGRLSAYT